ncbi:MAG TPA: hypothetical protein VHY09_10425, partial [Candidatus Methylacidiphilales bacterium]|nr:hypothetical protein [Candidatus Methylacidiphilales bacterium]
MNRPLAAALALAICASVARAQTITIKQDSVPEAIIPTTDKLAFPGPVTDNGVTLQLFRQQGEGVEFSPDGRWIAYDCKHADGYYNI